MLRSRINLRMPGYDYSQAGAYFLTICTQDRKCLFGLIRDGEMHLNPAGRIVEKWWIKLSENLPTLRTDVFIVMPNHLHGIITIVGADVGADPCVGPKIQAVSIPKVVQWFKTMSTNEYLRGVKALGWDPVKGRLWQRNYYEHVIRDETSLYRITEYITTNPLRWHMDRENPKAMEKDEFDGWLASFKKRPTDAKDNKTY